jgi:membrane dipeptidase
MKMHSSVLLVICFLITSGCQSYKTLHQKSILVDTHNDFPSASIEKQVSFDSDLSGKTHSDLNRMKKGGVDVQIFSIWSDGDQPNAFQYANRQIDSVYEWVKRNPRSMMIVRSPSDLKKAIKKKKLGAMLGVEGGHMIEDDLQKLEAFHRRGVAYLTITHNTSPSWASSAKDESSKNKRTKNGLTEFGKKVILKMNELGMLVDLSHVGEQTFQDIMQITTKPVIASHSNAYALCPHRRNLKDDQIKAIAKTGGLIHVNFYAGFLDCEYEGKLSAFQSRHKSEIDELVKNNVQREYAMMMIIEKYSDEVRPFKPGISLLIDHIDHIVKLVGVDHVGIGSDFDGISAAPIELTGVQDFPLLTIALMERGYRKKDIRKILGENFIRVFNEVNTH